MPIFHLAAGVGLFAAAALAVTAVLAGALAGLARLEAATIPVERRRS